MPTLSSAPAALPVAAHPPEERGGILDRTNISGSLRLPGDTSLLVGIGGHAAPPNSRLFSYLLPACDLAQKHADEKPALVLTSSLIGKVHGLSDEERRTIEVHTLEKIHLLLRFIREFFKKTFSNVNTYFGTDFTTVRPEEWQQWWNAATEQHPAIAREAEELIRRWHVSPEDFYRYTTQHAPWFRDVCLRDDSELPYRPDAIHLSVGGKQEAFFNRFREALVTVDIGTIRECIGRDVELHSDRRQLVFPSPAPAVPYGQATNGKPDHPQSLEADISSRSPLPKDARLVKDVQYTIDAFERLAGTEGEFYQFWKECFEEHSRTVARIEELLTRTRGDYRDVLLELSPSFQ